MSQRLSQVASLLVAAAVIAAPSLADEAPFLRPDPSLATYRSPAPPPLRLAEAMSLDPIARLRPATEAAAPELAAMAAWNAAASSGRRPTQVGLERALPQPLRFAHSPEHFAAALGQRYGDGWLGRAASGEWTWGTSIEVPGAMALRLELSEVALPAGTRLWVYGADGESRAFDLRLLRSDRSLVTPAVEGERIHLEIALPDAADPAATGLRIVRIYEQLADASALLPMADSCLQNAECYDSGDFAAIEGARDAVFSYTYVDGGLFACSGGLLNDNDSSTLVYWGLTANHCVPNNTIAATIDAKFFKRRNGCPGTFSTQTQGPTGWTLVTTSETQDVSLLRPVSPSEMPAGVALLGWTSVRPATGTMLHRISHPVRASNLQIEPQTYSVHQLDETPSFICDGISTTNFLHSLNQLGTGISGGSSGSPVMNGSGQVLGQLLGSCGDPPDGCGTDENVLDGAFSASYPLLAPYLNPGSGGSCVPDADTLCLLGGKFKVEVTWTTASASGPAQVMYFNGERAETSESGFFWFFTPTNFEMGVKMVDACVAPYDRYWVFVSGLTSQAFEVRVTRMANPLDVRTYTNPLDVLPTTKGDTNAFTCP